MAYLGTNGIIEFQRSATEPVVVPSSSVDRVNDHVLVDYDDWLLGEEVYLIHSSGVVSGYIHRDTLDRITFHSTWEGALNNDSTTRYSLSSVSVNDAIILASNINSNQLSYLSDFQSNLLATSFEIRMSRFPTEYQTFKNYATPNPWKLQGQLRRWELTRNAPEIDVSSIGEKFANYIKSTVSGSGTFDFIVNLYSDTTTNDVDPLLRLVQLTDQGSSAAAKFNLKNETSVGSCSSRTNVSPKVYFKADIIITASSVDVSGDDLIYGSADYLVNGPIRLLAGA